MSTNGHAVLGIDAHKLTHVAVVLDGVGPDLAAGSDNATASAAAVTAPPTAPCGPSRTTG